MTSELLRWALVDELAGSGWLKSPAVREAFLAVPREHFVPGVVETRGMEFVYTDRALVIQEREGVPTSSSSQPAIMAQMLEALDVHTGHRVLEVGLGTGYNAALLAHLVGHTGRITSVDIDPSLVSSAAAALESGGYPVDAAVTDGHFGWPPGAPYDRIIVTASTEQVPRAWWEQLAPGGVLVVPLRLDAIQIVAVFVRTDEGLRTIQLIPGGFMPLRDPGTAPDVTPNVTVRMNLPGGRTETLCAVGPGLVGLSAASRRSLIVNLAQRPRRRRVKPHPAMPVVLYTALSSDPRRQITVYPNAPGLRFGLVDQRSGAFSTFVAERDADQFTITAIETYGPDPRGASELVERLRRWTAAGSPPIERFTIEISYATSSRSRAAAMRTIRHADHTILFHWR